MSQPRHKVLDVVELRIDSGRWPAGTIATVLEADEDHALIEISDDQGHGEDFISIPQDALAIRRASGAQLAS